MRPLTVVVSTGRGLVSARSVGHVAAPLRADVLVTNNGGRIFMASPDGSLFETPEFRDVVRLRHGVDVCDAASALPRAAAAAGFGHDGRTPGGADRYVRRDAEVRHFHDEAGFSVRVPGGVRSREVATELIRLLTTGTGRTAETDVTHTGDAYPPSGEERVLVRYGPPGLQKDAPVSFLVTKAEKTVGWILTAGDGLNDLPMLRPDSFGGVPNSRIVVGGCPAVEAALEGIAFIRCEAADLPETLVASVSRFS